MASIVAGKAFFITGGASGMGLATVRTLLQRGASLGICDLDEKKLIDLVNGTDASHRARILVKPVNVADRSAIKSFMQATKRQFGRLDGIANVAGTGGRLIGTHSIWEIPTEEYDLVMDANTRGVFNTLVEGLVPGFMEATGSIVNVGSMYSVRGFKNAAPYCCSKHAMIGLTKTAAIEAGERGIRVNAVLPGCVDTPLLRSTFERFGDSEPNQNTPIPRYGKSEEIATVIAHLLSPESSFVTGAIWNVDGGANA